MLRLLLLRHAKSSWNEGGLADIDRPLSPRGWRDAGRMGTAMAADGLIPDRILCSPARRTRETLAAILPALGTGARVFIAEGLYEPAEDDYAPVIAREGHDAQTLLVIGHNPATQATAVALAGSGEEALRSAVAQKLPTAGLAVIRFETARSWRDIAPGSGRLVGFTTPGELSGEPGQD